MDELTIGVYFPGGLVALWMTWRVDEHLEERELSSASQADREGGRAKSWGGGKPSAHGYSQR
jgi:hypothetical protein